MSNQIVTVNVSVTSAPAPNTLQQTGAFLSQGGTTLAKGAYQLLTTAADLTAILTPSKGITSLTWSGSVVTVTTSAPHGFTTSDTMYLTINGAAPTGYNGTFLCTITGASTFTYPLVSNPGSETTPGTYVPLSATELTQMNTTFWAQGSSVPVYVQEIGAGSPAEGVTELTTLINASPQMFYSYLVPRNWASESTYLAFLASFESNTAKTYFFTTVTSGNYTNFTTLMKCVFAMIEAPSLPATEFSAAAPFWVTLSYAPGQSSARVTPLAFAFLPGTTPYPIVGNSTILATYKAAFINYIGTGAEGGLTNAILKWGVTKDGKQWNFWYATDWAQINLDLDLANAVINGSNNPLNPLYYSQNGINRLQAVAQGTMNRGVTYGLLGGSPVVNAVGFTTYTTANPSAYSTGSYGGLSATATPTSGFTAITFNLNVTNFPVS